MTPPAAATATSAPIRRTPPARGPGPKRRRPTREPAFEVVTPGRRRAMGIIGPIALFSLFGVLLLMAVFHALIVQGQRELDRLADTNEIARIDNDRLRLEVAEAEAPERIVEAARSFGMVDAPEVVYLSPDFAESASE